MGPEEEVITQTPAVATIGALQPANPGYQTTIDDIQNYIPQDLSPEQQQAFQQQYQPANQQLSNEAYYPGMNNHINVGNYSGSEIGSTTLFAPGSALVPLGMMDARDAAVQQAALKKAKDIEDFKKKYQSPTTKHVAVQPKLTESYFSGLKQWNQNALKKAGGNQSLANKMLESDPQFQNWNKSMQDTAKFHDAIVDHSAQLHADEKDPNFVLDPELKQQQAKLMNGLAYMDKNPFSKEGQQIGKDFLATTALYDLDKAVNTTIDKAIPNIEQLDPTYVSRGKNETATYLEKEYFTPEARKALAHNLYMEKYQGSGITEDRVQRLIDAKLQPKIQRKTDTYDKWFKPDSTGAKESTYESVVPGTKTAFNINTGTEESPSTKSIYAEKVYKTTATDEKKELSIPINKDMQDVQGKNIKSSTGHIKGTVSGIHLGFFDKNTNQYLTEEQAKKYHGEAVKNHNIVQKPVAVINVTPTTDEKGNVTGQNTVLVDASEIKGKFKNPNKKAGQQDFDDKIDELQKEAETHNEGVKSAAKAHAAKPAVKVEDLRKKYNY